MKECAYLLAGQLAIGPLTHELRHSPDSLLVVGRLARQQTGAEHDSLQPFLGHAKAELCARQLSPDTGEVGPRAGEASLEVANSGGQGRHRRIAARGRRRGRGRGSGSRRTDWAIGRAGQALQCAHARNQGVDLGPGVDAEVPDAPGDLLEAEGSDVVGRHEGGVELKSSQQRHFHDIAE